MQFSQENLNEINVLLMYKLTTTLEGIKVHKTAAPETIAAIKKLHENGLVTLEDGGYLTALGHEAAEQVHALFGILNP